MEELGVFSEEHGVTWNRRGEDTLLKVVKVIVKTVGDHGRGNKLRSVDAMGGASWPSRGREGNCGQQDEVELG